MLSVNAQSQIKSNPVSSFSRWDQRPRYVREYVWGADQPMYTTSAMMSETADPVPGPPENEINNHVAWHTINTHPHLFQITTPINVPWFKSLLQAHPNQPLVNSVCQGLAAGFWPWAQMVGSRVPSVVDNLALQRIKDPGDIQFMHNQQTKKLNLNNFRSLSCRYSQG